MEVQTDLKIGEVIIGVGSQGEGKTPTLKDIILNSGMPNRFVRDVRGEYEADLWTKFESLTLFKKYITGHKIKNSAIMIEEATGFVSAFKDLELSDWLTGVQHNRNIICFSFTALMDVPRYILRNSDTLILFNTRDDEQDIQSSRKNIYPFFKMKKPRLPNGHVQPVYIDLRKLN